MTNRDRRRNETQMDSGMIFILDKSRRRAITASYRKVHCTSRKLKKDFVSMSASAHAGKAFVVDL